VIEHLRKSNSRLRSALLLMAFAAMALQAAVPAGLMLDVDAATGELSFILCPSQGAGPMPPIHPSADGHDGHSGDSQSDRSHPSYEMPREACDFAVATAATILPVPVPATVATFLAVAIEPVVEDRLVVPSGVTRGAVSSRGPPRYS
jgi:hypothetical protein